MIQSCLQQNAYKPQLSELLFEQFTMHTSLVVLIIASICVVTRSNLLSCNSTENCNIECDTTSKCQNTTILCPTAGNYNCSVNCRVTDGCYNATIYAESVQWLDLECSQINSCGSVVVYGPDMINNSIFSFSANVYNAAKYSTIFVNNTSNIEFECRGISACEYMEIYAQNVELFDGYVSRSNSFANSKLYARNMKAMNMLCPANSACKNMSIYAKYIQSMHLECDNNACYRMNVDVSSGNRIEIVCDRCDHANIFGINAQEINLECDSYTSCNHTQLNCPSSVDSICSIFCKTPQSCSNLTVYNMDGYENENNNNLQFNCNGNNDNCNGAMILCTAHYNYSCTVSNMLESLECVSDTDSVCGISLSPTSSPTSPTIEPTAIPTVPSIDPSNSPTKSPITPTKASSKSPTKIAKSSSGDSGSNNIKEITIYLIIFGSIVCCFGICCMSFYVGIYRHRTRNIKEIEKFEENKARYGRSSRDGIPDMIAMSQPQSDNNNNDQQETKMEGIAENPIIHHDVDANNDELQQDEAPQAYIVI